MASKDDYKPVQVQESAEGADDDGLESALQSVGLPSRFLWTVFFLCSLPGIFNIWHLCSYVFQGYKVEQWCDVPELEGAGWTQEQLRNISGQGNESCSYYNYDYSQLVTLDFEEAVVKLRSDGNLTKKPCDSYAYNDYYTITAQWDLVCEKTALRSTAQMVVAFGKFLGALTFGFVADKAGRKLTITLSCIIYIIAGPLPGILPYYWVFVAARLFIGMAGSGCYNVCFTLLTEVSHPSYRTLLGLLYNMSYPVGQLLLPVIAYYLPYWQNLQLAISLPALLLLFNIWLLPESPRWLIANGRREDAWKVVKLANPEALGLRKLIDTPQVEAPQPVSSTEPTITWFKRFLASSQKVLVMFRHTEVSRRLFISYYMWWVSALTYYGLSLNASNFSADRYIYTALSGVVEAVGYLLPIPMLRYMGRRLTCSSLFLTSGTALLLVIPVPADLPEVRMAVAMVGRLCIGAVYSVVVLYTSELFPTVIRNTAVGTSSTMSHVGAILAPYIVDLLGEKAWYIPSTLCSVVALLAGLLVLLLPETKGRELVDTIEELDQRKEQSGDRVSIANCLCC